LEVFGEASVRTIFFGVGVGVVGSVVVTVLMLLLEAC